MGLRGRKRAPVTTVLTVAGQEIDVVFKSIKNINLSVRPPHGRVRVSAPFHVSETQIREVITERWEWIRNHQARIAAQPKPEPLAYVAGDRVMVWGAVHPLEVRDGKRIQAKWMGNRVILTCPASATREQRQRAIDRMYRRCIETELPGLLARWEPQIGHQVSSVAYRRMKTRWGTCQPSTGVVRLNTQLAKYPPVCLEYVVVHELVHFVESSHNQRFKALMSRFLPDWPDREQLLRACAQSDTDMS